MTTTSTEPVIGNPLSIAKRFGPRMRGLKLEQFWLITMDQGHGIIKERLISVGEHNGVRAPIRSLIHLSLLDSASAIAIVHNHPSGNALPTENDRKAFDQLMGVCSAVDVLLLDSVVICDQQWYSTLANELFKEAP